MQENNSQQTTSILKYAKFFSINNKANMSTDIDRDISKSQSEINSVNNQGQFGYIKILGDDILKQKEQKQNLQNQYQDFKRQHEKLIKKQDQKYKDLEIEYKKLDQVHKDLNKKYNILETQKAQLNQNHQKLNLNHQAMKLKYQKLNQNHQVRIKQYQELNQKYQKRNQQYQELNQKYQIVQSDLKAEKQKHNKLIKKLRNSSVILQKRLKQEVQKFKNFISQSLETIKKELIQNITKFQIFCQKQYFKLLQQYSQHINKNRFYGEIKMKNYTNFNFLIQKMGQIIAVMYKNYDQKREKSPKINNNRRGDSPTRKTPLNYEQNIEHQERRNELKWTTQKVIAMKQKMWGGLRDPRPFFYEMENIVIIIAIFIDEPIKDQITNNLGSGALFSLKKSIMIEINSGISFSKPLIIGKQSEFIIGNYELVIQFFASVSLKPPMIKCTLGDGPRHFNNRVNGEKIDAQKFMGEKSGSDRIKNFEVWRIQL